MKRFTEIVTAHGGGGTATEELLKDIILPPLSNQLLDPLGDSAIIQTGVERLCFTTDGYVVKPIIFPGGTIGDLAICGTVNDLAVMGADPIAISLSLILDEGLPIETLKTVMESIAASAKKANINVVTGDTKVVDRTGEPGMTITTAGIGRLAEGTNWNTDAIQEGDALIINGTLAEHGLAIMASRENLQFSSSLKSDVAPLNGLIKELREAKVAIRFARDCTRAGLAGVVADISSTTGLSVTLEETAIPLAPIARHTAEMLGLDPLNVANEGKVLLVIAAEDSERTISILNEHEHGRHAAVIGHTSGEQPALAEIITRSGGRRIVQKPFGEDLPRIC